MTHITPADLTFAMTHRMLMLMIAATAFRHTCGAVRHGRSLVPKELGRRGAHTGRIGKARANPALGRREAYTW
eukprot:1413621-Prorocentrum_lima.AAC.1